jgi:putative ABC transport system substrate-binding protein
MRRRDLIAGTLASIAVADRVRGQEARRPLVAILEAASETTARRSAVLPSLLEGLRQHGYDADRNLRLEMRFAGGDLHRLPALARELVALKPDVIFTSGTPGARAAAGAAGGMIPIVVGPAAEITMSALVESFARPGGNLTGLTVDAEEQDAKTIEFLKVCVPHATRMAVLIQPDNPVFDGYVAAKAQMIRPLGVELFEVRARNAGELADAFAAAVLGRADAMIATFDGLLIGDPATRGQVIALALRERLPSASTNMDYARDGGLMALSVDVPALARRAAWFVHAILQGTKPSDLPVERPTRVVLSINLTTARALGLTLPPSILLRADAVIE